MESLLIYTYVCSENRCCNPFTLRTHCLSEEQEKQWSDIAMNSFVNFLERMSPHEFNELVQRTESKYGQTID